MFQNQLILIEEYEDDVKKKSFAYRYDALGRRYQKEIVDHEDATKSYSRKYLFDGQEILAELDENNDTLAVYTHSTMRTDDVLAADVLSNKLASTPGSYFYLKDGLGSVTDITDASGNLVQHYSYSSFGELLKIVDGSGADITTNAPVKTSYGYTNREHDEESGLMYYRARYYEPGIGRFLSEDPHPGALGLPISFTSKYTGFFNNPVNLMDPEGKFPWAAFAMAVVTTSLEYLFDPEKDGTDAEFWTKIAYRTVFNAFVAPNSSGASELSAAFNTGNLLDIGSVVMKKAVSGYILDHSGRFLSEMVSGEDPKLFTEDNSGWANIIVPAVGSFLIFTDGGDMLVDFLRDFENDVVADYNIVEGYF